MALYRKTRISTLINIVGMSIAFAAAIILMVQVKWDVTYNKNFDGYEKVFVFEHDILGSGSLGTNTCRPLIEQVRTASPNIESVGTNCNRGSVFYHREGDKEHAIVLEVSEVDSSFFSVVPFEWLDGSLSDFTTQGTAAIAKSKAQMLFGDESPVGQVIESVSGNQLRVVAVYNDMPSNSCFNSDLIENLGDENINLASEWSYGMLLKLRDEHQASETLDMMKEAFLKCYGIKDEDRDDPEVQRFLNNMRLSNIHDAHFECDVHGFIPCVNIAITITLATIAALLIIIAIINFINFAFAEIPFKIKNINTRKVLGESRASLIGKQLLHAAVLAVVALGIAAGIVYIVSGTSLASYVSGSLKLADNIGLLMLTVGVALVSAVVAGIVPAIYSTSQPTTMVLKGSYAMSVKGRALRNVLVAMQFILSFIFILMALFVNVQTKYMMQKDMGINQANILQVNCGRKACEHQETLTDKVLQNPNITDVTYADRLFVNNVQMGWTRDGDDTDGKGLYYEVQPVAENFVKFFGLQIVDGRDFLHSDFDGAGCYIFNENFMQSHPEMHIGSRLYGHTERVEIVGVMKDFNFKPLQEPIGPYALYCWGKEPWRPFTIMYVKTLPGANPEEVRHHVQKTVSEIDPTRTPDQVNVQYLDQWIEDMYQYEQRLGKLISIASLVALIIAIIGIIGLVFFETQFLRREIAIRRVNGATVDSILRMINRKYIFMAVASFVVATPLTYMIITTWRSEFAYQAPVSAWIFAVAFALVVAITVAVVTLQSWRAANANPVEALKEN
ncbi:MAG: ABC transporter permease [Bacteroidales bacterium]|nr:ABC transporter permease [Bacteroidales bacterium]